MCDDVYSYPKGLCSPFSEGAIIITNRIGDDSVVLSVGKNFLSLREACKGGGASPSHLCAESTFKSKI